MEKVHSYGIMVFGLFMCGFDGDDRSVFQETVNFNVDAEYDACGYSALTPYPGTLTWYEMKKAGLIRLLRLDDVRSGARCLSTGADVGGRARSRPSACLRNLLLDIFNRPPISIPRYSSSRAMASLQSLHAQGLTDPRISVRSQHPPRNPTLLRCLLFCPSSVNGARPCLRQDTDRDLT